MRGRISISLALGVFLAGLVTAPPTVAQDEHSDNIEHLFNSPQAEFTNSDLAIWGKNLYLGNYGGFRVFDISDPTSPEELVSFPCPASQNDVSVWKDLLFVSVDGVRDKKTCDSQTTTSTEEGFQGIRIFNVADPADPRYIRSVQAQCGSHTHTLVPGPKDADGKRHEVYLYVSSYPSGSAQYNCEQTHNKESIIKVPLTAPERAKVTYQLDTAPGNGCHDVTVFMQLKIAAGACRTEGQIWDISNPAKPEIKEHFQNEEISFWHSAAFTWDAKYVAIGDEFGGGGTPGCPNPNTSVGAIWLYDMKDLSEPVSYFGLPRFQDVETCTAHNFNFIPVAGRYVLVASFYGGGVSVIDFTDPATPVELAYYDAEGADTWSSYWFNGFIYANDIARGLDVFRLNEGFTKNAKTWNNLNPQTQFKKI
jgi:hypothetical protein